MCYVDGTTLIIAGNGSGSIIANADCSRAFAGFTNLTAITGMNLLDISMVTDMSYMFYGCGALTELDISTWNISYSTVSVCMFEGCNAPITIYTGDEAIAA